MYTLINIYLIFFLKSLSILFFGTPGTSLHNGLITRQQQRSVARRRHSASWVLCWTTTLLGVLKKFVARPWRPAKKFVARPWRRRVTRVMQCMGILQVNIRTSTKKKDFRSICHSWPLYLFPFMVGPQTFWKPLVLCYFTAFISEITTKSQKKWMILFIALYMYFSDSRV